MYEPRPARSPMNVQSLPRLIRMFYLTFRLLFDGRVPAWTKLVPLGALAYAVWPLDFVPDLFPLLGQLDDVTIVLASLWAFLQLVPAPLVRKYAGTPPPARGQTVDGEYRIVDDEPRR